MGSDTSKPSPPPPQPTPPQELKKLEPWRQTEKETFEETMQFYKDDLKEYKDSDLNLCLVGHTGAGKSSLINSIYSISRNRIVDMVTTKSDKLPGVGTFKLVAVNAKPQDVLGKIKIFDTMGFTGTFGHDDKGITDDDIRAVCEGRVKDGHKFNTGEVGKDVRPENKPHCIAFVISAEVVRDLSDEEDSMIRKKLLNLRDCVPDDVAQIAIITKCDRVCNDTFKDIENIYKSKTILTLIKRTEATFGMPQNKIFPIVNYVTESFLNDKKSLPIMSALSFAVHFASDRQ